MTLETINDATPEGAALVRLLKELQADKTTVVAGAGAATNIAVAGLGVEDTIVSVVEYQFTSGAVSGIVDRTAHATIQAAGQMRVSDATTGSTLIVKWEDKTP